MPVPILVIVLARSFLAGSSTSEDVYDRGRRTLGRNWRWLKPLAARYAGRFACGTRPRHRDVVRFLLEDEEFSAARRRYGDRIAIAEWIAEPQRMQPVEAALSWQLPVIESAGDLADWLSLTPDELDWYADLKRLGYKVANPVLRHYCYRILLKSTGIRQRSIHRNVRHPAQRSRRCPPHGPEELLSRTTGCSHPGVIQNSRIPR